MNNDIINIIRALFGSDKVGIKTISIFLLFSIIAGWLPDGIVEVFKANFADTNTAWIQIGFPLLAFIGLFVWLRHVANTHELTVKIEDQPSSAKGLILFLSESKNTKEYQEVASIAEMKSNWQMPLIALSYHANSLSAVKIITSSESSRQFEEFKAAVSKFLPDFDMAKIEKYPDEIHFEDGESVFKALDTLYKELTETIKKHSIYIDLTGGTKVVALVGSIFALPEDRTVQYVSTTDKKVRLYDLHYNPHK
jgi:hypothetical protein